jgi:hypothetical protein
MVKEAISIYDRGIEAAWDNIKRRAKNGDPECAEIIEGKGRNEFVWNLLQGDIIEKFGGMASVGALNGGIAESELARRVSQKLGLDLESTRRWIGELIAKGVLRLESIENGLRWHWTDTNKLKHDSKATPAASCQA